MLSKLTHLLVDAPMQSSLFDFSITADPSEKETVWGSPINASTIDLSVGLSRHRVSTPQIGAIDVQIGFTLTTSESPAIINRVALYGFPDRLFAPEDAATDA